jgi:hypothetical protein
VVAAVDALEFAWLLWETQHIAPSCLPYEMRFGKLVPNWMCARHAVEFERIAQEQKR